MNYYGSIISPYVGDVLYTRPDEAPVAPEEKAEPIDALDRDRLAIGTAGYPHYCVDVPPPSIGEYRKMRELPIIVFAYHVVIDPILAGTRELVIRSEDGDAPKRGVRSGKGVEVGDGPEDKRKRAAERVFEPHWADILTALECINFGHWTQEVTWDRAQGLIAPVRFNSFRPWEIVLVPDKYNDFAGFKLGDEERDARYAFHAICEEHRAPLIGHPRARDALSAAWRMVKSHENGDRIERKASGIQMMIGIMSGMTFRDATGNVVTPEQAVQTVKDAAVSGKTWTRPLFAFDKKTIEQKPELANVPSMVVDKFDWGNTGPNITAGIERRRELAVEIVRAYHRPERESMEAEHGSRADSTTHGQVGITDSELLHADILTQFNEQTFNRFLVTNWGPDAADGMYWKASPLADPQRELFEKVLLQTLADPVHGPSYEAHIDRRAFMQKSEMPLLPPEDVVEPPPMAPTQDDAGTGDDPLAKRMNGNGAAAGTMAE
jgi:hypothetical protein